MKTAEKTVIVLGATGLVGGILLDLLLADTRYKKVILFSRRSVNKDNPKITEHICDLLALKTRKEHFKADEVFCCIGSTNAKTPNKKRYKEIDYGIPITAAELCKSNRIPTLIVVSALGADATGNIFYSRIKGEMEDEVLEIDIPKTHIVQPSMIGGHRDEKRPREYVSNKLMSALNFLFLGPLKKYRVVHPKTIALAMQWLANNDFDKKRILSDELKEIVKNG